MAARKPAITGLARPQGIVDDIAKAGMKAVMHAANKLPNKTNKLAKKYAKERVIIQAKYDAQLAAEKVKNAAIREKGTAALSAGKKVSKEDWQKLSARKYKGR
jgi:ABC-type uncharacterized transport system YnjBCD substrate-binding protein